MKKKIAKLPSVVATSVKKGGEKIAGDYERKNFHKTYFARLVRSTCNHSERLLGENLKAEDSKDRWVDKWILHEFGDSRPLANYALDCSTFNCSGRRKSRSPNKEIDAVSGQMSPVNFPISR